RMHRSWQVYDLKLEAIRVGEEHCIVAGHVIILARCVHYPAAVPLDFRRELIDPAATVGGEGDFADSHAMSMEPVCAKLWIRLLHPNGAGVVVPSAPTLGSVFGIDRLVWIAESRQQPVVEALCLFVAIHVQHQMIDSAIHRNRLLSIG